MNLVDPSLLDSLHLLRFRVRTPVASGSHGDRRSRVQRSGLEFADFRPYQFGDDVRHIDRHAWARLRRLHVKLFSMEQRLPVLLLVDASASMAFGDPDKFSFARALTAALGYIGLATGEKVVTGALVGDRLQVLGPLQGRGQARRLFEWLSSLEASGQGNWLAAVETMGTRARPGGLAVLISDWLTEDIPETLATLRRLYRDVVGVHVLAPEELEPERLGAGAARLVDAESGQELEVSLEPSAFDQYRAGLAAWRKSVEAAFLGQEGKYIFAPSDTNLRRFLFRDLRTGGLLA